MVLRSELWLGIVVHCLSNNKVNKFEMFNSVKPSTNYKNLVFYCTKFLVILVTSLFILSLFNIYLNVSLRVPLACTRFSHFAAPFYLTLRTHIQMYDSTSFARFRFNILFFYEMQIHSIKLSPFPELLMEINISN